MKSFRFLFALALASFLGGALAHAGKDCDCGKDSAGKVCGEDTDCCCTGAKAKKGTATKDAKKEGPKKQAVMPSCCLQAKKAGAECSHQCCIDAAKEQKNCGKCGGKN